MIYHQHKLESNNEMKFNNRENKAAVTHDGDIVWRSRSIAVCVLILTGDDKVLIAQRSDKVDHGGKWALPCGYIDWDESIHQAVIREVWEELGINIDGRVAVLYNVNDSPHRDERQNVTFHFMVTLPETSNELSKCIKLCDESTQFDFLDEQDILKKDFGDKQFAFNHDERIYNKMKDKHYALHITTLNLEADTQF
jgi:8-oxo-dGTP pyrophosphatase MutT (NUDIX family)